MSFTAATEQFERRLYAEWLPTYCQDPARKYSLDGFRPSSIRVTEIDARDCMRAIDHAVVVDQGGGRYKAPRSAVREVLFWEGLKKISPRPITLWIEPVITMAASARLHLDHGWPKDAIGMQSKKWGFDLVAYAPRGEGKVQIVSEVKKTERELQKLISELMSLSRHSQGIDTEQPSVSVNTRRKWDELLHERPRLLWALGPGGVGSVFTVSYSQNMRADLAETEPTALSFANAA